LIGLESKLCQYTDIKKIGKKSTDKDCVSLHDRPVHPSGRAPQLSFKNKNMATSPERGLEAKTDVLTD